ncbi:hypothetical protein CEXT_4331 [Caerostris extrusa]|uniref:Uncharacterized protein n=1 Tax=Caerostris extrusa TaxID=172846 RepID=A0AAV4S1P5_CAEEX|nr:hypothetical protein CEXT_4331 [Caerostris extrusa]
MISSTPLFHRGRFVESVSGSAGQVEGVRGNLFPQHPHEHETLRNEIESVDPHSQLAKCFARGNDVQCRLLTEFLK